MPPTLPVYDISDLVPLYINLSWSVVSSPRAACNADNFTFQLFNQTTGGPVDTTIFSIVGTGTQQAIKVWT
jgi:hypothetical protein